MMCVRAQGEETRGIVMVSQQTVKCDWQFMGESVSACMREDMLWLHPVIPILYVTL